MVEYAFQICIAYYIVALLDPYILSWQALNRPIVVAPLVGLILNDFQTGIIMGAGLESIFMGISAIGGQIPADATTASIIAVSFTILTGGTMEAGIALSLPIGTVMASINSMLTPIWASFAPYWERLSSKPKQFFIQNILFSAFLTLVPTIVLFLAISFGVEGLNGFLESLPAWVMTGLNAASGMMLAVGFAILTSMIWSNEVGYFFIVGYALVKYLNLGTLPIAIFGAAIAITMFLNEKKLIDLKNSLADYKVENKDNEEDFF